MQRVKITRWCSHNGSRACLAKVLANAPEIAEALRAADAGLEWTTPDCFIEPVAEEFKDCIVQCGGAAELVDC